MIRRFLLPLLFCLLVLAPVAAQEGEQDPEEMFNTQLIQHRVGAEVGGIAAGGIAAVYTYTPVIRPLWRVHVRGGLALSIPAFYGPGFHIPVTTLASVGTRNHRLDMGLGFSISPNAVDEKGEDLGGKSYLHATAAYRLVFQEDRTVIRIGAVTWSTPGELQRGDVDVLPSFSLETAVR